MYKYILLFVFITSTCQAQFATEKNLNYHCNRVQAANLPMQTSMVTTSYDVKYHRCEWYIDPVVPSMSGSVATYFTPTNNPLTIIDFDFVANMTVDSVVYHGAAVSYAQQINTVVITLPSQIPVGTLDSLEIIYHGMPIPTGFGSFTMDFHNGGLVPIISTLSEPYGARDWWPCKQSLDDKIDSLDIFITVPNEFKAGSIGVLAEIGHTSQQDKYHWTSRYPITAYLVGIAVTDYQVITNTMQVGNDTLEIVNYVFPEDSVLATTQLPFIIDVIHLYDSLFVNYPFVNEKYGHCQWTWGGGEEHQTMSFVLNFDGPLLAHECAHQWFGDMVTCGSFEDVWLNEGFATYSEALTKEFLLTPADWMNWKVNTRAYVTSQTDGSVFCTDTSSVGRIFDGRLSYDKGAFVLHMLRWELGDSAFFQGVRNYLNDTLIAYNYAKTPQLKSHLELASGKNLTTFFDQWYYGEGYPNYSVNWNYQNNDLIVQLNQSSSHSSVPFFEMDIPIEFSDGSNDTIIVFNNTNSGQIYQIPLGFTPINVTFDPEVWILASSSVTYDPSIGISDLNTVKHFNVFPNPVSDVLRFNYYEVETGVEVYIRNVLGKEVYRSSMNCNAGSNNLNVDFLETGIYAIELRSKNVSLINKFFKN